MITVLSDERKRNTSEITFPQLHGKKLEEQKSVRTENRKWKRAPPCRKALEQEEEVSGGDRAETEQLGSGQGGVRLRKMHLRQKCRIQTPSLHMFRILSDFYLSEHQCLLSKVAVRTKFISECLQGLIEKHKYALLRTKQPRHWFHISLHALAKVDGTL